MVASNQRALAVTGGAVPVPLVAPGSQGVPGADSLAIPGAEDGARHRLARQRLVARGSTVLGVAAMAAVGAGGVAAAAGRTPAPLSVPDLPPGGAAAAVSDVPAAPALAGQAAPGAGQRLITRILAQAQADRSWPAAAPARGAPAGEPDAGVQPAAPPAPPQQQAAAGPAVERPRQAPAPTAATGPRQDAPAAGGALREAGGDESAVKEAAARKVREEAARKKAEEEARQQAAALAAAEARALSYVKPVSSATLAEDFGSSSSRWGTAHTGQDFAAPTGTPVLAVHGGTVTAAGWAGSFGYRIVLTLPDGTQLWYCHLSTMVKTAGAVGTGEVIGRVGATGNVTSPHLHLEVRPGGGAPVDPVGWLREHGVVV